MAKKSTPPRQTRSIADRVLRIITAGPREPSGWFRGRRAAPGSGGGWLGGWALHALAALPISGPALLP